MLPCLVRNSMVMIENRKIFHYRLIIAFICICSSINAVKAQNTTYNQFSNEIQFTEALKNKFSAELNFGQAYTSTPPDNKSMFAKASQFYLRAWIHYQLNAKWKLSYFHSFFLNKSIPEIDQNNYHELRSAIQGIYYMHKIGYTLQSRFRIEDRQIQNASKTYEAYYRLRTQVKYTKPINNKILRKGVYYGFGSEEFFFKTQAALTGKDFFDRNRFTLGAGYCFTDDLQMEISYANEYLPRNNGNQTYHTFQANFTFNDVLKKIKSKTKIIQAIDGNNN